MYPSMTSKKHNLMTETTNEPESKKAKFTYGDKPSKLVFLNPADCSLDFDIEGDGLRGVTLCEKGFAYCWSGARANVGIKGGKYCFGCRIVQNQEVTVDATSHSQQNLCHIGISRVYDDVGNLGDTPHSFGYDGTGKFANSGMFFNYGETFGEGDTVVCAVNLETNVGSIAFSKNGKPFGPVYSFEAGLNGVVGSEGLALFPHILLKNVIVEMQFIPEDGLAPQEGYKPWSYALTDGNAVFGPAFSDPGNCEVIMMVGLPASGKTTWIEKIVKEHPAQRYVLLETKRIMDQMKVPGLPRTQDSAERAKELMDRVTQILNDLLPRAASRPRNYIIDQANVYRGARKRKLKLFADYWKVAVVVFPTLEELISREKSSKEMGKESSAETAKEMIKNYVLPKSKEMQETDEFFDKVIFTELNREEAQRSLDEIKFALSKLAVMLGKSPSEGFPAPTPTYGSILAAIQEFKTI